MGRRIYKKSSTPKKTGESGSRKWSMKLFSTKPLTLTAAGWRDFKTPRVRTLFGSTRGWLRMMRKDFEE